MGVWWEATVQQLCSARGENLVKKTSVLELVRNGTRRAGSMYGRRRETLSKPIIRSSLWPGWWGEGEMRLQFKYRIITECTSDIMAVALIQTTGPVWAIISYSTNNTACSLNRNVQFFSNKYTNESPIGSHFIHLRILRIYTWAYSWLSQDFIVTDES